MRIFVESTKSFPRGERRPIGTYAEVVAAVHMLFPKRKWLTARKGIGSMDGERVEVFLTTHRNKNLPPALMDLLRPLIEAQSSWEAIGEIRNALILPDEMIDLVILNDAERTIASIVEWAAAHDWQVREWPDGPVLEPEGTKKNRPNQAIQPTPGKRPPSKQSQPPGVG